MRNIYNNAVFYINLKNKSISVFKIKKNIFLQMLYSYDFIIKLNKLNTVVMFMLPENKGVTCNPL